MTRRDRDGARNQFRSGRGMVRRTTVSKVLMAVRSLAARGESPAAFERRCIPAAGVASRSNTGRSSPSARLVPAVRGIATTVLGATRGFTTDCWEKERLCAKRSSATDRARSEPPFDRPHGRRTVHVVSCTTTPIPPSTSGIEPRFPARCASVWAPRKRRSNVACGARREVGAQQRFRRGPDPAGAPSG